MYKIGALLLSVLLAGCNDAHVNRDQPDIRRGLPTSHDVVPVSLKSSFLIKDKFNQEVDSFVVGDEITFELNVINSSDVDVTYQATDPVNSFIVRKEGEEVWSQHHGMMFAQVMVDGRIAANGALRFTAKWSGRDNEGAVVQPGRYEILSELVLFSNSEVVTVPPPRLIDLN